MSIGLKRGTVRLEEHQTDWEENAKETAKELCRLLDLPESDVQHVGSTAVRRIMAKPIIDLAVGVTDYESVLKNADRLEKAGFVLRRDERPEQLLFVKGDFAADTRSHHIHVVVKGSAEWNDYLDFRDYLNADADAAARYEAVKKELAEKYKNDRDSYTEGKSGIISELLLSARRRGKSVRS